MFFKIAISGAVLAAMVGSATAAPHTATTSHNNQGRDDIRNSQAATTRTHKCSGSLITPPSKTPNFTTPRECATTTARSKNSPVSHFVK